MDLNLASVASVLLPFVGSFPGSLVQRKNMDNFYDKLSKPWWTPPKRAFPIVWTYLYGTMGYASYLVYRDGGGFDGIARLPLTLYAAKLVVNWAFTPIFFGAKKLGLAALDTFTLTCLVAVTGKEFHSVNATAGWLFVPYLAWCSLASSISLYIWKYTDRQKKIE